MSERQRELVGVALMLPSVSFSVLSSDSPAEAAVVRNTVELVEEEARSGMDILASLKVAFPASLVRTGSVAHGHDGDLLLPLPPPTWTSPA